MDKREFRRLLDETHQTLVQLTSSKGEEYSRDTDQLANFKRQAEELNATPEKILMVYLNKHLDAIKSFVKTGKLYSEPIEGRIDDAILYLILLKGIVLDDQNRFAFPTEPKPMIYDIPMTGLSRESGNDRGQKADIRPQFELK